MNFHRPFKTLMTAVVLAATAAAVHAQGSAQWSPTRPGRMVVPFPPGGAVDVVGRIIAARLPERLGQQVVVDNRGGAYAIIGTEITAKAAPDGHTIGMVAAGHTITPSVIRKLPYDPVKDFAGMASSSALIQSGKIRALGVTTARRAASLPDVPTIAEAGVPGYEVDGWYGLAAPAATPVAAIQRFNRELVALLALPEVKARLLIAGIDARPSTPAEFQSRITRDIARWADVVKKAKISLK